MRHRLLTASWRLLVLLRERPHTLAELASELEMSERNVRRHLSALEAVPLPISQCKLPRENVRGHQIDVVGWSLGSMPEWPRNQATPIAEIRRAS